MSSLEKLCDRLGVTLNATCNGLVPELGGKPVSDVRPGYMFHWTVSLTFRGHTIDTSFYTGLGHINPPPATFHNFKGYDYGKHPADWRTSNTIYATELRNAWYRDSRAPLQPVAADVLSCLLSDAQSGSESFEEFCGNYGYDTDSRKAHATWTTCKDHAIAVHKLLGRSYDRFVKAAQDH